jgi:dTMP kinase
LLLFIAARLHHGRNVIQPALDAGMWVLCDRFMASSLVYQGIVGGVGMELVEQLHGQAGCTLVPDKTFIIMLDPEIAMRRRQANRA